MIHLHFSAHSFVEFYQYKTRTLLIFLLARVKNGDTDGLTRIHIACSHSRA